MSSPQWLADEGIRIEQEVIRENVGSQDQIWAAYGGTNVITFHPNGSFTVNPVIMTPERSRELESHLMLFFTRFTRISSLVAGKKIQNLPQRHRQLTHLRKLVDGAAAILTDPRRSLLDLGPMLHESWTLKRELAEEVTTPLIDMMYDAARSAGALGGKLLGAGGGGFMLLFAKPEDQPGIREKLRGLIEVSLRIGSTGSRIVVYEPDDVGEPDRAPARPMQ